jgi:hypothetical protein
MRRWRPRLAAAFLSLTLLLTAGCGGFFQQLDQAGRGDDERLLGGPQPPAGTPLPSLESLEQNLAQLDSYRAVLSLETGGAAGAPASTLTILQEVIRAENRLHYSMVTTGDPASDATLEYFQEGRDLYLLTDQGPGQPVCERMTGQSTDLLNRMQALTPESLFGPIQPDRLVTSGELVNGVLTDRYTVDQVSMGLGESRTSQGEVWIAREGGYVVRFSGQADGVVAGFAPAAAGSTSRWLYELSEINALADIRLSTACLVAKTAAGLIPIPASAEKTNSFGGVTTFQSAEDFTTIADFYRAQLAEGGWQVTERMNLTGLVILDARRENLSITVSISKGETATQVMIEE